MCVWPSLVRLNRYYSERDNFIVLAGNDVGAIGAGNCQFRDCLLVVWTLDR